MDLSIKKKKGDKIQGNNEVRPEINKINGENI